MVPPLLDKASTRPWRVSRYGQKIKSTIPNCSHGCVWLNVTACGVDVDVDVDVGVGVGVGVGEVILVRQWLIQKGAHNTHSLLRSRGRLNQLFCVARLFCVVFTII